MRNTLPLAVILATALAAGAAFAEGGTADQSGSMGAGKAHETTRAERAQARKDRKAEAARENRAGELSPGGEASGAAAAPDDDHKYTKGERAQARKDRLKETARENRSGEIQSGEH